MLNVSQCVCVFFSELSLVRVEALTLWAIKTWSWTWSLWYPHCHPPTNTKRRQQTPVGGTCVHITPYSFTLMSSCNTPQKVTLGLPCVRGSSCVTLSQRELIEQLMLPPSASSPWRLQLLYAKNTPPIILPEDPPMPLSVWMSDFVCRLFSQSHMYSLSSQKHSRTANICRRIIKENSITSDAFGSKEFVCLRPCEHLGLQVFVNFVCRRLCTNNKWLHLSVTIKYINYIKRIILLILVFYFTTTYLFLCFIYPAMFLCCSVYSPLFLSPFCYFISSTFLYTVLDDLTFD